MSLREGAVDLPACDIASTNFEKDESILADGTGKLRDNRDGKRDCEQTMIGIVITRDGIQ